MEEVDEVELVVQRVAALDLGKATLEACMRVPHTSKPGRRMQEIRGYATTTAAQLEMAIWLRQWGIERVVMESTSDYWKGVYYLLEAEGFDCWLVNAREVKNVPGRHQPRNPCGSSVNRSVLARAPAGHGELIRSGRLGCPDL